MSDSNAADIAFRVCPKCNMARPLGHFNKHKRQCKECRAENQRRYYGAHRERLNGENKARAKRAGYGRRSKLAYAYGEHMTPERYESMLAAQGGVCAICRKDTARGDGAWGPVDHCHATGEIRGILCTRCNAGIAQFGDDPDTLMAAIAYLARFQHH